MKQNSKIAEEVEKTLDSLEGLAQAKPRPFFYTRLEAALEKHHQSAVKERFNWMPKPAFIWSALGLVVVLNIFSAINYATHAPVSRTDLSQNSETAQDFASEYGLEVKESLLMQ